MLQYLHNSWVQLIFLLAIMVYAKIIMLHDVGFYVGLMLPLNCLSLVTLNAFFPFRSLEALFGGVGCYSMIAHYDQNHTLQAGNGANYAKYGRGTQH